MKVKKERNSIKYGPPPQFSPIQKPSDLANKELWLIQIPPGIKPKELNGTKLKLKNNKVISVNENTELLVQKRCGGYAIAEEENVSIQGQLTLRHKIEIPILSKPEPVPLAGKLPSGLKYRLSKTTCPKTTA